MTTSNLAQIAGYATAFLVGFIGYFVWEFIWKFIQDTVLPALRRRGRFTVPVTGKYLDRIGKMYDIKRKFLESDESYRNRIAEKARKGVKPHE